MKKSRLKPYFGLKDTDSFKTSFIEAHRGKHLFLVRFQNIGNIDLVDFVQNVRENMMNKLDDDELEFGFHIEDKNQCLIMGIASTDTGNKLNIDNAIGTFHDDCFNNNICTFDFGVGRTQCNWISDVDEIFNELNKSALRNLNDNLVRWSWTYFNKANAYFSAKKQDAVIQPTVHYNPQNKTFSVVGGEVFVGGGTYSSYQSLIDHIPPDQDRKRFELLILEKLVLACQDAPGILKFNISPQSLLDTFNTHDRVTLFNQLLNRAGLKARNIRLELVEKPYDENKYKLKDICRDFWNYNIGFAADDFGVKSQSHQVILDLGLMIKEFKLDPISFKFKAEEDPTKFLDNLAFIDYCKRLADNREAVITAEAVEDLDTLNFLLEHQIYHFQAFIFSKKMPVKEYIDSFSGMKNLHIDDVKKILSNIDSRKKLDEIGNIFKLAGKI